MLLRQRAFAPYLSRQCPGTRHPSCEPADSVNTFRQPLLQRAAVPVQLDTCAPSQLEDRRSSNSTATSSAASLNDSNGPGRHSPTGRQRHRSQHRNALDSEPRSAASSRSSTRRPNALSRDEEQKKIKLSAKSYQVHGQPGKALALLYRGLARWPDNAAFIAQAASLEFKLLAAGEPLPPWPAAQQRKAATAEGNSVAAVGELTNPAQPPATQLLEAHLASDASNVYLLTTAASVQARCHNFEAARLLFQRAYKLEPDNAAVLQAWAVAEAAAGNEDAAQDLFQTATEVQPGHAPAWSAWAQFEARRGRVEEARRRFSEARRVQPSHVPALHAAAAFEAQQGNLKLAAAMLRDGLSSHQRHLPSWMLLAEVHWRLGARDAARATLRQAEELVGPQPELLCAAARLELNGQNLGSARDLLVRAAEAKPRHVRSLACLEQMADRAGARIEVKSGELPKNVVTLHASYKKLQRRGRTAEAAACLHRLRELAPDNGFVCHSLGLASQQEGRVDEAQVHFERGTACKELDGSLLCHEALAELHAFQRRLAAAEAAWQAGARRGVSSRFLRQWALYEKKRGRLDEAATLFQRAMDVNAQDYKTLVQWGVMEWRRGNIDTARRLFDRCTAMVPRYTHVVYLHCTMLWQEGLIDEARQLFQRTSDAFGRYAALWMQWGLMEWKLGDHDTAHGLFERGAAVPDSYQHAPLYEAWADLCDSQGDGQRASELRAQAQRVSQRRARSQQKETKVSLD